MQRALAHQILSKLPMRQIRITKVDKVLQHFSKLPMRQIRRRKSSGSATTISKLPMRQISGEMYSILMSCCF